MLRTSLAFLLLAGCNCSGGFLNKPNELGAPVPAELSHTLDWNQENLKRNDHGCPTAIYIAPPPNGILEQCP